MNKLLKKATLFALTACMTVAGVVATGCNNTPTGSGTKTELLIANYSGGVGMKWLDEIEEDFEEKYADYLAPDGKVGIDLKISHDKGYLGTTLSSSLSADRNDVYFTQQIPYVNMAATGSFRDITALIEKQNPEDNNKSILDKFSPEQKSALKVNGKYFAVPHYEVFQGIVYDAGLFESKHLYFADAMDSDGTRQFVYNTGDKKSCGPDGKYNTYDDGLPSSVEEFIKLVNYMASTAGVTPFAFPGKSSFYTTMINASFTANLVGANGMKLMLNFGEGVADDANTLEVVSGFTGNVPTVDTVKITPENGYLVKQSAGIYYSIDAANKIFSNASNYYSKCTASTCSNIDAQDYFVRGGIDDGTTPPIGMLIEGNYWYNEAIDELVIENVSNRYSVGYQRKQFKFMPLPVQYEGTVTEGNGRAPVLIDDYASYAFIKNGIDANKVEAAELLLSYLYTDAQLTEFTVNTNGIAKALEYDLQPAFARIDNPYAKSLVDMRKAAAEAGSVIRWVSDNSIYRASENLFNMSRTEFWSTTAGGKKYSMVYGSTGKVSAKDYFLGMSIQDQWASMSSK